MSAPFLSLLADELNTSVEKAKKLYVAMLREVRKRARRQGVQLPEFGTFRASDGEITFEPSPSLARAVNHRFEGLPSEDLGPVSEEDTGEEEEDDGPNTITLGYQESDWSPLDSEEEASATAEAEEEDADTEEFEVPSADEAPDTDAFEAPDTGAMDAADADASSPPEPSEREAESSETEDLYPLVEDVPEGSEDPESASDSAEQQREASDHQTREPVQEDERDSLSGIWSDEEESEDDTGFSFDEERFSDTGTETGGAPEPDDTPTDSAADPEASTTEVEIEPEKREAKPTQASSEEASSDEKSTSIAARVGGGLLVLLLLGGAAWYVLGQRGTVPPPRPILAELRTQVQSQVETLSAQASALTDRVSTTDIPLVGPTNEQSTNEQSASTETETAPTSSDAGSDDPTSSSTDGTTPSTSEATESTSEPTASDEASPGTDDPSSPSEPSPERDQSGQSAPQGIRPAEGGWTVVVASRAQKGSAESLAQKYRTAFADQNIPVGVLTGTVNTQTQYRVGVGQFESRSNLQSFFEDASNKLPEGAWPLRLQ